MSARAASGRTRLVTSLVATVCLAAAAVVSAQVFDRSARSGRSATPEDFDGQFHFCRLAYEGSSRGRGGSAMTDYPDADINMSIRLSELTKTNVSFSASRAPNHLLVRPGDDELFGCPMVMMMAPGSVWLSDEDASRLRDYLLKGGFIWADDFWGTYQWEQWESQLRLVLPEADYPIVDLPMTHPLLQAQFIVTEIPQIPNIGYFLRSGGDTSEQGADSAVPRARMILDDAGQLMVLMTHNTDIADSWEREGEDESYFLAFSPRGYAFGINVFLYALTH